MNIAVVGCGVIGMTSAAVLSELGHRVTLFTDRPLEATVSSRAGAVFTPFDGALRLAWVADSLQAYRDIIRDHSDAGVRISTAYEYLARPITGFPAWTELCTDRRRLSPIGPYHDGYAVSVPHIDTAVYLPWLQRRLTSHLRVSIVTRALPSLDTLFRDYPGDAFNGIINCSGLGASTLAADPHVRPIRGQLVHVPNDLRMTDSIAAVEPDDRVTYVYPFPSRIVLGGTFQLDNRDEAADPRTSDDIIERCRALLRSVNHPLADRLGIKRLREVVGLRPARIIGTQTEAIRLERVEIAAGRGRRFIIHNYGHGRAGISMSWGCAKAVARLIEPLR